MERWKTKEMVLCHTDYTNMADIIMVNCQGELAINNRKQTSVMGME